MKKTEFKNFIGIDVSKKTLDVAFLFNGEKDQITHQQFSNDLTGIRKLIRFVSKQQGVERENTAFCLEHTGIYGRKLIYLLFEQSWRVWLEMPVAILRSMGLQRGKNDKVDAKRIAIYAMKNIESAKFWEAPRKQVDALRQMLNTRELLVRSKKALSAPMKEYKKTGNKELSEMMRVATKGTLKGIETDILKLEQTMEEIINSDSELTRLVKLLISIPAVGKITAIELICFTNEFKNYTDAKQLACYCGIAPFEHTSGTSVRKKTRVSKMANMTLKTKLHLCAMVAIQYDPEIKTYYERKVIEGKNKMSVINAVRNKLVHRITAVVKRQTPFVHRIAA